MLKCGCKPYIKTSLKSKNSSIAQMEEQTAVNRCGPGSIPGRGAFINYMIVVDSNSATRINKSTCFVIGSRARLRIWYLYDVSVRI